MGAYLGSGTNPASGNLQVSRPLGMYPDVLGAVEYKN